MNPNQPEVKVNNPLATLRPGERVIAEIKRHPIGLFGLYLGASIIIALAVAAAMFGPRIIGDTSHQTTTWFMLGAAAVVALALIFVYVGSVVYNGNRWIVTDDSITQVKQISLFSRQSSQLSLANLEDITVEQNGLLPSLLGFGILKAETAGEHSKFVFYFCPRPNEYARTILAAHEAFMSEGVSEAQKRGDHLTAEQGEYANSPVFQNTGQPSSYVKQDGSSTNPTNYS